MITKWTSHLSDPEEKERFENQVMSAKPVLERLAQILKEDRDQFEAGEMSAKYFDTPNWDYKSAYNLGCKFYNTIVQKIINLETKQEETNDRQFTRTTTRSKPNTGPK